MRLERKKLQARACIKVAAPAGRKSRRGKKPRKERLTGNRKEPFEETALERHI
jgi:hypothetical protein